MLLALLGTLLPHPTRRYPSNSNPPTYSTTVLHPSQMGFLHDILSTGTSSFGTRPTEARSMTWVLVESLSTKVWTFFSSKVFVNIWIISTQLAVLRLGALRRPIGTWRNTKTSTPSSFTSAVWTGKTFLTGGWLPETSLGKKMKGGN